MEWILQQAQVLYDGDVMTYYQISQVRIHELETGRFAATIAAYHPSGCSLGLILWKIGLLRSQDL